jgi:hypothetical protein
VNDDGLLTCVANLAVVIESDSVSVGLGMIFFSSDVVVKVG